MSLASNGLEALEAIEKSQSKNESDSSSKRFDVVLVSWPSLLHFAMSIDNVLDGSRNASIVRNKPQSWVRLPIIFLGMGLRLLARSGSENQTVPCDYGVSSSPLREMHAWNKYKRRGMPVWMM